MVGKNYGCLRLQGRLLFSKGPVGDHQTAGGIAVSDERVPCRSSRE